MRSRDCFWCKQPCLSYSPQDHKDFPYICLNCGQRIGEEIPFWKNEWDAIVAVAVGITALVYLFAGPIHTGWSRYLCVGVLWLVVLYIMKREIE